MHADGKRLWKHQSSVLMCAHFRLYLRLTVVEAMKSSEAGIFEELKARCENHKCNYLLHPCCFFCCSPSALWVFITFSCLLQLICTINAYFVQLFVSIDFGRHSCLRWPCERYITIRTLHAAVVVTCHDLSAASRNPNLYTSDSCWTVNCSTVLPTNCMHQK